LCGKGWATSVPWGGFVVADAREARWPTIREDRAYEINEDVKEMRMEGRMVEAPVLREIGVPMALEEITVLPPKEGEVLVRLVASGVCHSCLHRFDGSLRDTPMPVILGDEGAGIIEEIGPGTTALEPGDHVVLSWAPSCGACRECLRGRPARCRVKLAPGCLLDGTTRFRKGDEAIYHNGPSTFSPVVVVRSSAAIKIKDSVPLQQAALVGCAVSTGVGAVLRTARVECGQSVAVIGCGGVGLNSVYAAHLAGAHPIVAVDPVNLDYSRDSDMRLPVSA
jgi:S-(hydroxymethyl)glutathione dehydrogenase/alcohol dehydrogenase